ncbi:uncharacterized protein LOC120705521 [Panicum virgatum]|uniref:uncharacterized protein LOC120705521 n=1 Tax=Panicum virgatum TaxID=38727 RepID=UPI0019D5DC5B|nr:uncharacterized protein LOC120705521 [Panicum virgatum]
MTMMCGQIALIVMMMGTLAMSRGDGPTPGQSERGSTTTLVRVLIRSLALAGDRLSCRGIEPLPCLWWAQFSVRRSTLCSYRFGWAGILDSLQGLMGLLMMLRSLMPLHQLTHCHAPSTRCSLRLMHFGVRRLWSPICLLGTWYSGSLSLFLLPMDRPGTPCFWRILYVVSPHSPCPWSPLFMTRSLWIKPMSLSNRYDSACHPRNRDAPRAVLVASPPRRRSRQQPQEFTIRRSERLAQKSHHRATKPAVQAQNVMMRKLGFTSDLHPPDASAFQQFEQAFSSSLSVSHCEALDILLPTEMGTMAADVATPVLVS